jgi:hypothetical protein
MPFCINEARDKVASLETAKSVVFHGQTRCCFKNRTCHNAVAFRTTKQSNFPSTDVSQMDYDLPNHALSLGNNLRPKRLMETNGESPRAESTYRLHNTDETRAAAVLCSFTCRICSGIFSIVLVTVEGPGVRRSKAASTREEQANETAIKTEFIICMQMAHHAMTGTP